MLRAWILLIVVLGSQIFGFWSSVKAVGGAIVSGARGIVRGVREAFSGLAWVIHRFLGLPELLGSLFGIRFTKKFRLKVVILPGAHGVPLATTDAVEEVVEEAKRVFFRNRMKVRIIAPSDEKTIVSHFGGSVPDYVRRPECGFPGWLERYKGKGRWYARHSLPYSGQGTATVFVVDDVHEGSTDKNGCFLNLVDYGYIDSGALRPPAGSTSAFTPGHKMILAHELGHSCDLLHREEGGKTPGNLMRPTPKERTHHLTSWQIAVVRSSRRVRYF
jgi:hypothetical protein